MKKKSLVGLFLVTVLSLGILSGCGNAKAEQKTEQEYINITHNKGETKVPKNPKRVAVLDLGSLDILDKMGINPVALPQDILPDYLEKYKSSDYINVGNIKEFNMEKVNESKPDLIIIEGRQEASYDEFSKIAPTIYLGAKNPDQFEGVKENVKTLGEIFDKKDVADKELENIKNRLDKIKGEVQNKKATALVTMVNDGAITVFGEGSRYNSIYKNFGFEAADKNIEVSKHGQVISYEYLSEKNPEYLFVIDKGLLDEKSSAQPAKNVIENDLIKQTNAYKNGHIVYLKPQIWYVGGQGLQVTEKMMDDIEGAIK